MATIRREDESNKDLAQVKHAIESNVIKYHICTTWIAERCKNINCQMMANDFLREFCPKWIGNTALHFAVHHRNTNAIINLVQHGANVTLQNKERLTPLHMAVQEISKTISKDYLLNNELIDTVLTAQAISGNFKNPENDDQLSHFHLACALNHMEAVKGFLNSGIPVDYKVGSTCPMFPGFTPLHFAVKYCAVDIASMLLDRGANRRMKNNSGMAAIHIAMERKLSMIDMGVTGQARDRNDEMLRFLLESEKHYSDSIYMDFFELSQLHAMCTLGDTDMIENFLPKVKNINHAVYKEAPVWAGYTALHFAAMSNLKTVKLLLNKGADISITNTDGVTALDMCAGRYDMIDIYEILSSHTAWRNVILSDSKTTLAELVYSMKNPQELDVFLRRQVNNLIIFDDAPLWAGCTVLHLAVMFANVNNHTKMEAHVEEMLTGLCTKYPEMLIIQDIYGHTPVHIAYILHKTAIVDLLLARLKKCPNLINCIDEDGLSFVHMASACNKISLLKKLLKMGANVNSSYTGTTSVFPSLSFGSTALHFAVVNSCPRAVKQLLKFGANVCVRNLDDLTPIHLVLLGTDRLVMGKYLLKSPTIANVVAKPIGLSHLHVACMYNNIKVVDRLIQKGANINGIVKFNLIDNCLFYKYKFAHHYERYTPLAIACERKRYLTVKFLLQQGADVFAGDGKKGSALYDMFELHYKIDYLFYFLGRLKDHDILWTRLKSVTGMTILHWACFYADLQNIAKLVKAGHDVNARISSKSPVLRGYTPLHVIIHCSIKQYVNKSIELLVQGGADVTLQDDRGYTPLHMAYENYYTYNAGKQDLLYTNMLLAAHSDFSVNPVRNDGVSHFHIACDMHDINIINKFLVYGNINIDQTIDYFRSSYAGYTALHLVSRINKVKGGISKKREILDLLINNGANLNADDAHGDTPLHTCIRDNLIDVFERLVRSGADANAPNICGETPLRCYLQTPHATSEGVKSLIRIGCRLDVFNPVTHKGLLGEIIHLFTFETVLNLMSMFVVNFKQPKLDDHLGRTAIHNIVSTSAPNIQITEYVALINQVSLMDCDIDEQDTLGQTPLHVAVKFQNFKAVSALLHMGADFNILNNAGRTPYAYAYDSRTSNFRLDGKIYEKYIDLRGLDTFLYHVKKLQHCKLDVHKQNVDISKVAIVKFKRNLQLTDKFLKDLRGVKAITIEPHSLTIDDFLCETKAISHYSTMSKVKREDIHKFFNPIDFQKISQQFCDVSGLILLQFRKIKVRCKLEEEAKHCLAIVGRVVMVPDTCSRIVFELLSNLDLESLIIAATPIVEPNIE